jgi:hypothetical protein
MREIMRAVDPVVNHNVFFGGDGRIQFNGFFSKKQDRRTNRKRDAADP